LEYSVRAADCSHVKTYKWPRLQCIIFHDNLAVL